MNNKKMKYLYIFLYIFIGLPFVAYSQSGTHSCDGKGDCKPVPKPDPEISLEDFASMQMLIEVSVDPNELDGPRGVDSVRWVSVNDILNYTIFFENDPVFATAHAQVIDVSCEFPHERLMDNFVLGNYCFANKSYTIPNETSFYSMRLDERDSLTIFVDIAAGLDIEKKTAFWNLSSIDPETGYAPWEVDRGILPVNDSTHIGEGFVTFHIKPCPTMQTGDTISMFANIVFDSNDSIATNRWCNMVDAGAPKSSIAFEVDSADYSHYRLRFNAQDDKGGCGVEKVYLYMADIWGNYQEYAQCKVDTVIDFYIEKGKEYKLYSIATDRVGNREPVKIEPDLVLNFNLPPTDIMLSNSDFRDDVEDNGYIGEFSAVDTDDELEFVYTLVEGDGAIHNEMFAVVDNRLHANDCFKCCEDSVFHIRVSATDDGGLSYSKHFELSMSSVYERPEPDSISVNICEDDIFVFRDKEYDKAGIYYYTKSNEQMCDSVYVISLTVSPIPEKPQVTVTGVATLHSSYESGNQWFKDGVAIENATGASFTPTEDGVYYVAVSNGACYSEPSDAFRVKLSDDFVLGIDIEKGWNWISSNLTDDRHMVAMEFLSPISDNVERFLGFESEIIRDPKLGLAGNLKTISPTDGYLVYVNDYVNNQWEGTASEPAANPIQLKKGWNWIGYIPVCENSLEGALANLSPSEGDVIKDYDDFAVYTGNKWSGTLTTMKPGCGYMYFSDKETVFVYPSQRAYPYADEAMMAAGYDHGTPWNVVSHKYPYNMSIIAQIYVDGVLVPAGLYTIGAFVDEECRGIGEYVDDRLYMTVYGEIGDDAVVEFRAVDNIIRNEYPIAETVTFRNSLIGNVKAPLKMNISGATDVDMNVAGGYNIYPNPVRERLYVNGDIAMLLSVKVLASNGVILAETNNYTTEGLDVSHLNDGAYIAVLETETGVTVKKIVKMK